jgi:hypothetical protein
MFTFSNKQLHAQALVYEHSDEDKRRIDTYRVEEVDPGVALRKKITGEEPVSCGRRPRIVLALGRIGCANSGRVGFLWIGER